jgi:serine/threonine protein kinase
LFIGKGEKHQLELIQKIRGSIEWPGVHDSPYYPEFKSSPSKDLQVQNYTTNYKTGIQEPFAVDFIDALLTLDPKQRININRAIDSIFLRSKPLSNALELLFSNNFSMSESNEASHNTTQHDQNVPQRRNMPNVPHEAIY